MQVTPVWPTPMPPPVQWFGRGPVVPVSTHEQLTAAVGGHRGASAANRLCRACVSVLQVDAAAISLIFDGANSGTLGASSAAAQVYDELQFTLGEGPCLDSVAAGGPIMVADLADPDEVRWPMYGPAMLAHEIHSVHALPVVLAGQYVGALDLYRVRPSALGTDELAGALVAAQLAEMPLLDLLAEDLNAAVNDPSTDVWTELHTLARLEISQATGMLMAQLDVDATQAVIRLRAHAYTTGRSATDVARDILDRGLLLENDR